MGNVDVCKMKGVIKMTDFEMAIKCMLEGDGACEALYLNTLTDDQRERFEKIKEIYLEECLKDCDF